MTDNTARKLDTAAPHEPAPRVVYTQAPVLLGVVQELDAARTRALVRVGALASWAEIDVSVDPLLLEAARERGSRVVLDTSGGAACIVGVLMTARTLEIDHKGNLEARVKKLVLHAEEALIQTPHSFLRLRERASEFFGDEVIVRGRLLTRIFGKTIKLN